jgi:hypothetical protein
MKYFGSVLEFTHERNTDLLRAFRVQMLQARHIRMTDIFSRVVQMPSSRFWVSEERAAIVVSSMLHGRPLTGMRESKKRMFREIYRRVVILRAADARRPLSDIVSEVIHQPAPSFYMSPGSAKEIIYRIKRGYYNDKRI